MKIKFKATCLVIIFFGILPGCKKYLDVKSDKRLAVPQNLSELQAILDNVGIMNASATYYNNNASDEYFLNYSDWNGLSTDYKGSYTWDAQTMPPEGSGDWIYQYRNIFYANTVLDNLLNIDRAGQESQWDNIKGSALFFRAWYFTALAQLYSKQYNSSTAKTDLGIVLKLNSDPNEVSKRSTLQETYDQIIGDLEQASVLLDARLPVGMENKTRPTRTAAFALLARVHLYAGNYLKSKESSDSCLKLYNILMDYKTKANTTNPFSQFNEEVIFHCTTSDAILSSDSKAKIDTILYKSYLSNDQRKTLFFASNTDLTYRFKGNYTASRVRLFNGLATDEVFLTRAEANARLSNTVLAIDDVNTLLKNRLTSFVPLVPTTAAEALSIVLQERKKELVYRGTRWADIRRLNLEPSFSITLKRVLNSESYTLPPNDLKYTFLIPQRVISLSGMQQNPR